jgi:hypothetical protein
MMLTERIIPLDFVTKAAPCTLHQHGHDFHRAELRLSTAWVAEEVLRTQPLLNAFESIINRHKELEQQARSSSSFLNEPHRLLAVRDVETPSELEGTVLFNLSQESRCWRLES